MALQQDMFGKIPGVKQCACCRKYKESGEFNTSKVSADGLQAYCKSCQRIYHIKHPSKEYKRNKKDEYSLNIFDYEKDSRRVV